MKSLQHPGWVLEVLLGLVDDVLLAGMMPLYVQSLPRGEYLGEGKTRENITQECDRKRWWVGLCQTTGIHQISLNPSRVCQLFAHTHTCLMIPKSPCKASIGCRNTVRTPRLFIVVTNFSPILPLLPIPDTINLPPRWMDLDIVVTALAKPLRATGSVSYKRAREDRAVASVDKTWTAEANTSSSCASPSVEGGVSGSCGTHSDIRGANAGIGDNSGVRGCCSVIMGCASIESARPSISWLIWPMANWSRATMLDA